MSEIRVAVKIDDDPPIKGGMVMGAANGVPGPLDGSGKLPAGQVPATGGSDPTALHAANNLSDVASAGAALAALAGAPLASPALTGSPTAPTKTALDNSTKLATTAYADSAVAALSTASVHVTGDEAIAGIKTFAATTLHTSGAQIGTGATGNKNTQLKDVAGTKGRRVSFQNASNAGGTSSVEIQLIPDSACDPSSGISTEILMFNKTGADYERAGLVWSGNVYQLFVNYNGAGSPRSFEITAGGSSGLGIGNQNAIVVHGDASVDLLGSSYTVTTPIIPAATTVSSVVAGTSCVLSAAAVATTEWPAGSTATQTVIVNGRTVIGCTLTAGSTTVLGNFLVGDAGTAITSVGVFGANRTRVADMADTGKTRLVLDTCTTTPGSTAASDQSLIEFRRGGARKWLIGDNAGGANIDSWDVSSGTQVVLLAVRQNGNVGLGLAANQTALFANGVGVIGISNATTVPTTNPTGGHILYSDTGALKGRGTSGTVTTIAAADPHCADCGRDFALEWESDRYGHLALCMWCLTDGFTKGIIDRSAA